MNWTMNKEEELKIDVVVFYRCSTLSAKSLVQDVTLMTKTELHALIGFSILTIQKISKDANVKSWILIISLSSIFSILFLGWFILFAYYNTCACMVLRKLPDNTHSAVAVTKKSKFPKLKTSSASNDVDQQIISHSAESSDNDKKLEVEADDAAHNPNKMDWSKNKIVISDNLSNFVGKHCTLGVDEAGRGPVLGPMVYACGVCVTDNLEQLSTLKAKDSKTLTEDERSTIFKNMQSEKNSHLFAYTMKLLSPVYISKSMLGRSKYNLNEISHDTAMELIQIVCDAGVVVDKVILDTVGPAEKYEAKLRSRFPKIDILVSKKADSLHTIVSAASICAKVTRDNHLSQWSESSSSGQQFGSGYPSDPNTVAFLNNSVDKIFGFHSVVRFSWSTAKQLLDTKCVPVVEDNEKSDEVKPSKLGKRLTSYFQSNKADNALMQRHAFFEERCISSYLGNYPSGYSGAYEFFNTGESIDEFNPRTLYVGNLDATISEEFLLSLFSHIGGVSKCKIIHETASDPYAFVEFVDHASAVQALTAMNKRLLLGKIESTTISSCLLLLLQFFIFFIFLFFLFSFIVDKNMIVLPVPHLHTSAVQQQHSTTVFAQSSLNSSSGVAVSSDASPLTMTNNYSAVYEGLPIFLLPNTKAVLSPLKLQEMRVNWATSPGTQAKVDTSKHFHVFVGDLSPEIDNKMLREAFAPYGEISDVKVIRDLQTLKSKGYGFDAERAIEQMNDEDLRRIFARFGSILEVRVFKQQGYAFVRFDNKESAAHAILNITGTEINGSSVRCSWGKEGGLAASNNTAPNYGYGYNFNSFSNPPVASHSAPANPNFWNQYYTTIGHLKDSSNENIDWAYQFIQVCDISYDELRMSVQASQKTSSMIFQNSDVREHRNPTVTTDPKSLRLIWIDCEMTGLDIDNDRLMEIACMGPNIIIHQDDALLANMNEWCKTQHGKTGLTEAVQQSTVTEKVAEKQMLEFLSLHTSPGLCPLAGNSIGRDRQFIEKYMPDLAKHIHYRNVDVTTIAELCKRWLPDVTANTPEKKEMHRALDDIREKFHMDELQSDEVEVAKWISSIKDGNQHISDFFSTFQDSFNSSSLSCRLSSFKMLAEIVEKLSPDFIFEAEASKLITYLIEVLKEDHHLAETILGILDSLLCLRMSDDAERVITTVFSLRHVQSYVQKGRLSVFRIAHTYVSSIKKGAGCSSFLEQYYLAIQGEHDPECMMEIFTSFPIDDENDVSREDVSNALIDCMTATDQFAVLCFRCIENSLDEVENEEIFMLLRSALKRFTPCCIVDAREQVFKLINKCYYTYPPVLEESILTLLHDLSDKQMKISFADCICNKAEAFFGNPVLNQFHKSEKMLRVASTAVSDMFDYFFEWVCCTIISKCVSHDFYAADYAKIMAQWCKIKTEHSKNISYESTMESIKKLAMGWFHSEQEEFKGSAINILSYLLESCPRMVTNSDVELITADVIQLIKTNPKFEKDAWEQWFRCLPTNHWEYVKKILLPKMLRESNTMALSLFPLFTSHNVAIKPFLELIEKRFKHSSEKSAQMEEEIKLIVQSMHDAVHQPEINEQLCEAILQSSIIGDLIGWNSAGDLSDVNVEVGNSIAKLIRTLSNQLANKLADYVRKDGIGFFFMKFSSRNIIAPDIMSFEGLFKEIWDVRCCLHDPMKVKRHCACYKLFSCIFNSLESVENTIYKEILDQYTFHCANYSEKFPELLIPYAYLANSYLIFGMLCHEQTSGQAIEAMKILFPDQESADELFCMQRIDPNSKSWIYHEASCIFKKLFGNLDISNYVVDDFIQAVYMIQLHSNLCSDDNDYFKKLFQILISSLQSRSSATVEISLNTICSMLESKCNCPITVDDLLIISKELFAVISKSNSVIISVKALECMKLLGKLFCAECNTSTKELQFLQVFVKIAHNMANALPGLRTPEALRRLASSLQTALSEYEHLYQMRPWKYMHMFSHTTTGLFPFCWVYACLSFLVSVLILIDAVGRDHAALTASLLLCMITVGNLHLASYAFYMRRTELFRKGALIVQEIERLCANCPTTFYLTDIYIPLSDSVELCWVYRDDRLVSLPVALLVDGDIALLRPGRPAPCRCRELFPSKQGCRRMFQRGDRHEEINEPDKQGCVEPCACLAVEILESPAVSVFRRCCASKCERRPPLIEETNRILHRYMERILLPVVVGLGVCTAVVQYCLMENLEDGWIVAFLARLALVVLPLLMPAVSAFMIGFHCLNNARLIASLQYGWSGFGRMLDLAIHLYLGQPEHLPYTTGPYPTLGSVTSVGVVDKKGILSLADPSAEKVFFFSNDGEGTPGASQSSTRRAHVLDLSGNGSQLQFDDPNWNSFVSHLKPVGLNALLNGCGLRGEWTKFLDHLEAVSHIAGGGQMAVNSRRCLCTLAKAMHFDPDNACSNFDIKRILAAYRMAPQLNNGKSEKTPVGNAFATVLQDHSNTYSQMMCQGSADMLMPMCSYYWDGRRVRQLDKWHQRKIKDFATRYNLTAYCLALTYRPLPRWAINYPCDNCYYDLTNSLFNAVELKTMESYCSKCSDAATSTCSLDTLLQSALVSSPQSKDVFFKDHVFLGMVAFQYQAKPDVVRLIERLDKMCIRFIHFSKENEFRSRVFAEKMGLETGWNCHISLEASENGASSTQQRRIGNVVKRKCCEFSTTAQNLTFTSEPDVSKLRLEADVLNFSCKVSLADADLHVDRAPLADETELTPLLGSNSNLSSKEFKIVNSTDPSKSCSTLSRSVSADSLTSCCMETDPSGMYGDSSDFLISNQAQLPKGIDNIRPHLSSVDNVPLLVPLFTDCVEAATNEMLRIMQENDECVCVVGSSLNVDNAELFCTADVAVSVEPELPVGCCADQEQTSGLSSGSVSGSTSGLASLKTRHQSATCYSCVQLAHRINSLPCAFSVHSLDKGFLTNAFATSMPMLRRFRVAFYFLLSCSLLLSFVQLASLAAVQWTPFAPDMLLWLLCLALPVLSASLAMPTPERTAAAGSDSPLVHKRRSNRKEIVTFFTQFSVKFLPSGFGVLLLFVLTTRFLQSTSTANTNDHWPQKSSDGHVRLPPPQLLLAQNYCAWFFLLYMIGVSASHVHCYELMMNKPPTRNRNWLFACLALQLVQSFYCSPPLWPGRWKFRYGDVPWFVSVFAFLWTIPVLCINEAMKRLEASQHQRRQRRRRLSFDTKLGMNSPF
ncbi:Ribonuclease H2 subunit A [Trichinella sp. T9]|nr:Ribonuclease H2 subunit A [Trichinella sp. T9]